MNNKKNNISSQKDKPYFTQKKHGLFLLFMLFGVSAFSYNIRVEIENCPPYYIYLGSHRGPDFEVIDSVPAQNGVAVFKSDKNLPAGVYFIVIPPQSRFDFLLAGEQNITIKTDARDILGKLVMSGERQYTLFAQLQQDIAKINKFRSQMNMELEFYKSFKPDTVDAVTKKLDSLNLLQNQLYTIYKNKTEKGTLLYKILNILEPFAAPQEIENLRYTDPATHYNYYKDHYTDRVDFTDASLLNTPEFVFHRLLKDYCFYFFDTRVNQPETVYPDIDSLIAKTGNNPEFRRYILSYLISRYESPDDLRQEAYLVYVYRNYYLVKKPDWVSDQAYAIMKFRIGAIEHNVMGNIARDLNLPDSAGVYHSVYGMDCEFKVLLFWEPDCDICNETALILSGQYPKLRSDNIEIYAVLTNPESEEWSEFIQENALDWINVHDPERSSNFETYYGTYKTPRIYILNNDNKIIGKDIKPESIYSFIQNYKNNQTEDMNRFNFIFGK